MKLHLTLRISATYEGPSIPQLENLTTLDILCSDAWLTTATIQLPSEGLKTIEKVCICNESKKVQIPDNTFSILAEKSPRLQKLIITNFTNGFNSTGEEVNLPFGFPALRQLSLSKNKKLTTEKLVVATTYEKLEELDISDCINVTDLPDGFHALKKVYAKGSGLSDEKKTALKEKYKLEYID